MNKTAIEREARKVQFEVWSKRKLLWPAGEPPILAMFEPRVIAQVLELEYEIREQMGADGPLRVGFEAAGLLDRRRGILAVSSRFRYPTQRFTAAHEIGHYVLHPWIGDRTVHRDRAVDGAGSAGRPPIEQEADYFAACLLVPLNLETAVGCARVCRDWRAGQGETTQWAPAHKAEQRSMARQARCDRVHSALTHQVNMIEAGKVNVHAVLLKFASGQLPFLG